MSSVFYKLMKACVYLFDDWTKLQKQDGGKWGRAFRGFKNRLTRPVVFKTVEEMEDHHDQRVERDECNIHLEENTKQTPNQHMKNAVISWRLLRRISFVDLLWTAQSTFGCSPQHSYWPRDNGGPFSVCNVCKHCGWMKWRTKRNIWTQIFLNVP